MTGVASILDEPAGREKNFTLCRVCHAHCSLVVELEGGIPVKVYGDKHNPRSRGFSCVKGRGLVRNSGAPDRQLTPLKKTAHGHVPIGFSEAISAIAARLRAVIERHGPRAVAVYSGTFGQVASHLTYPMQEAFMKAIGSGLIFSSAAIDQPGKFIAKALHGDWASEHNIADFDVVMIIGANPIIAMALLAGNGPSSMYIRYRKSGLKMIVVDPRQTETSGHADIFLQPRPGRDAAILAGMIRWIITNGLHDEAFLTEEANGFAALSAAVEPFTLERVAELADIDAGLIVEAARTMAEARSGMVICGTGPNFAPGGALTEYLGRCLVTICGLWPRAGDKNGSFNVLMNPLAPPMAASFGPYPAWGFGEKMRFHGLTATAAGLPTAILPDEILVPGEGQVRALLVMGGNPRAVFPDQGKMERALKDLELLVCVDPKYSATAELADFTIAPTLTLEQPMTSTFYEWLALVGYDFTYTEPFSQYVPALTEPPAGSEVVPDWKFYFALAREMGLQLEVNSIAWVNPADQIANAHKLDMAHDYTSDELLELLYQGSPVPLSTVKALGPSGGLVPGVTAATIAPKPPGWDKKFDIGNAEMMADLGKLADRVSALSTPDFSTTQFPFALTSRRMRDRYNSTAHRREDEPSCNPLFMNPLDMADFGFEQGDPVRITSDAGSIIGAIETGSEMRRGAVSMTHAWTRETVASVDPARLGGNPGRLISTDRDCDPHTWMARQSAIPVRIDRLVTACQPN
jgi:anaerobic selenocysteine-containing dehydrogenase